ncbi:MAG: septal ring lytic transglycosylase RlpA family protein [Pseudomonadota bacterium]
MRQIWPPRATRSVFLASTCITLIATLPLSASADRQPAPIKYAAATLSADKPDTGKRLEYRYPDQPDTIYGAGGARQAQSADPIRFSSDKAAIVPAAAKQYALSNHTSAQNTEVFTLDPAIGAGGFDARAEAARVAAAEELQVTPVAATAAIPVRPVSGVSFNPAADSKYDRVGVATLISADLAGQPTANGEIYDKNALSAAHPTLPLPSLVHVINSQTRLETVVRVNDRGPIAGGGLIELSDRAAEIIGILGAGEGNVRVRYLGPAPVVSDWPDPSRSVTQAPEPVGPVEPVAQPSRQPQAVRFPAPPSIGEFFVQLGSFSEISNAERLHRSLQRRTSVKVVPVNIRGRDFFRVLAGPFEDRTTARAMRDQLANQGVADGVVVSSDK